MKKISRREFGGALVTSSIIAAAAGAQDPQSVDSDDKKPSEDAEALADYVIARYGERLDKDQRKVVRKDASDLVKMGAALAKIPLTNADEPDTIFRAVTPGGPTR